MDGDAGAGNAVEDRISAAAPVGQGIGMDSQPAPGAQAALGSGGSACRAPRDGGKADYPLESASRDSAKQLAAGSGGSTG